MLYKLRWDIEKVFDVFKNKLEEKKAWGSSDITKIIQALFICITHNLTLMMNKKIEKEEKVVYTYDIERKEKNLNSKEAALDEKKIPYTSTWRISLRVSQITIKFYRWLRNNHRCCVGTTRSTCCRNGIRPRRCDADICGCCPR